MQAKDEHACGINLHQTYEDLLQDVNEGLEANEENRIHLLREREILLASQHFYSFMLQPIMPAAPVEN